MLPTKPLTDVLKSAPEITSLSATDRVQIVDANGVPKRITQKDFLSDINDFGVNLVPGSLKKLVTSTLYVYVDPGTPIVISLESYEAVQGPESPSFYIQNSDVDGSDPQYSRVSPGAPAALTSRGRIALYTSEGGWSTNKGYFHKLKIEKGYSASKWSPAPEDLISLLGGGVNRYSSTHYAILQKGGLRDDADEGTYQRPAEEQDGGRDGAERVLSEYRRMQGCRDLAWRRRRMLGYLSQYICRMEVRFLGGFPREATPYHSTSDCGKRTRRFSQFHIRCSRLDLLEDDDKLVAYGKEVVAA